MFIMPGPAIINLDRNFLCRATGWQNNCGLNCLAHFLDHLLKTDFLQDNLSADPEYLALLDTFQEYYELDKPPTWQEVKALLDSYPVATDKEGILAPVLRLHLGKILTRIPEVTWDTDAAAAISDFITTADVKDVALPIYHSNVVWFEYLRGQYNERLEALNGEDITEAQASQARIQLLANNKGMPNEQQIAELVLFSRKNQLLDSIIDEAKPFWLAIGNPNYGHRMGRLENAESVSAEQLSLLTESLSIGLEVYTQASIEDAQKRPEVGARTHGAQNLPEKDFLLTLRVFNSGAHWEYEEPTKDLQRLAAHNKYYPATSMTRQFMSNANLSGQFKLFADNASSNVAETIKKAVQRNFAGPVAAALEEIEEDLSVPPAIAFRSVTRKPVVPAARAATPVSKAVPPKATAAPVAKAPIPVVAKAAAAPVGKAPIPVVAKAAAAPVAKAHIPVVAKAAAAPVAKAPIPVVAKAAAAPVAKAPILVVKPIASAPDVTMTPTLPDTTGSAFNSAVLEQINSIKDDAQKTRATQRAVELSHRLNAEILDFLNKEPQLAAKFLAQDDKFIDTFVRVSPTAQKIKLKNLPTRINLEGEMRPKNR